MTKTIEKAYSEVKREYDKSDLRMRRAVALYHGFSIKNRYQGYDVHNPVDLIDFYSAFSGDPAHSGNIWASQSDNIVKSIIDMLSSKAAKYKVRPLLTPMNTTGVIAHDLRNTQRFFDVWLDEEKIYQKVPLITKDAMIFSKGVAWVDEITQHVERVAPVDYYYDPIEYSYGEISQCFLRRDLYPTRMLERYGVEPKKIKGMKQNENIVFAWDLVKGKRYILANNAEVFNDKIKYEEPPFEILYWNDPIRGSFSRSVCDELEMFQMRIYELLNYMVMSVKASVKPSVLMTGEMKKEAVNNDFMNVYSFGDNALSDANRFAVITPQLFADQIRYEIDAVKRDAREYMGINESDATGMNPKGIRNVIQVETIKEQTSNTFLTKFDSVINLYSQITEKAIKIFPPTKKIKGSNTSWGDAQKAVEGYKVIFSPALASSKDAMARAEQLSVLISNGSIDAIEARLATVSGDVDRAIDMSAIEDDAVAKIINDVVTGKQYKKEDKYGNAVPLYPITISISKLLSRAGQFLALAVVEKDEGKKRRLEEFINFANGVKKNEDAKVLEEAKAMEEQVRTQSMQYPQIADTALSATRQNSIPQIPMNMGVPSSTPQGAPMPAP